MFIEDAAWESFLDKRKVSAAYMDGIIQKTLQNMHWERRPRGECNFDEQNDNYNRRGRSGRAYVDEEEDVTDEDVVEGERSLSFYCCICLHKVNLQMDIERVATKCTWNVRGMIASVGVWVQMHHWGVVL